MYQQAGQGETRPPSSLTLFNKLNDVHSDIAQNYRIIPGVRQHLLQHNFNVSQHRHN
jgi:hypothetical protein